MDRSEREIRAALKGLIITVQQVLKLIDKEMVKPSTPERGSHIAKIMNHLDMQNQLAMRSLGWAWSKIKKERA